MDERKPKNKTTILGSATNFIDTVTARKKQRTKYQNPVVLMEEDTDATASSSKSTLNTLLIEENNNMEITKSQEATPERNISNENEILQNNTVTEGKTKEIQQQTETEVSQTKVITNINKNIFENANFITLETKKGKTTEEKIIKEKQENYSGKNVDDNKSINSVETNLSENEKWRIEINAKRYKAWIKIQSIKGNNIKEKTQYLLNEIKDKCQWVNLSREKNPNEKGIHLTLTFDNETELQKILQIELETNEVNKKTRMTRAPITRKNRFKITNSVVKFWDIPIRVNRQAFIQIIENKFGKIVSSSARLNGLYHTIWVEFESQQVAEEILEQKSQIVGDECVRVTTPEIKYTDLLEMKKEGYAAKVVDVPPTMTPAELFTIMKQLGAQTCYMPVTRNGNKKGFAIISFESQEIQESAIGKGFQIEQHVIKIMSADTKVCHQCKSIDHLVKDCQIAKEIKEREFRQRQNYQRFGQTYKRYQPKVFNTLTNKYTNKFNSYAEVTKRKPRTSEYQQQNYNDQNNHNENGDNRILQTLNEINSRLNNIEDKIQNLNDRVDQIENEHNQNNQMQYEESNNAGDFNNNENNTGNTNVKYSTFHNEKKEAETTTEETNQVLLQIIEKLKGMESQIRYANQRIDQATTKRNQTHQQLEDNNNHNQY